MAVEGQPFLVQAIFSFKGKNNDELCFKKGDIITVTQFEEGGWWEGTFSDKTGWFPSNYVKEYKVNSDSLSPIKTIPDMVVQQRAYRGLVLKDFIESEKSHVTNLQNFISTYLLPLEKTDILMKDEYKLLVSNIKEVVSLHENILTGLETITGRPPGDQRVGKMFLSMAPKIKQIHHTYCAGHPRAVSVINKHKQKLSNFSEELGGNLITLTSGLSKPFRRIEKYNSHLQEVERHLEENHPDRGDTQRAVSVYKDIAGSCSMVRRQKELELEVVTGGVRGWEGQDLSTLGEIVHMGSVAVGPEHRDRYLVLFHTTLLILSVSHRMSAFIYEGKLPLTGIKVNKLEDSESYKNAFEVVGPLIDRIVAVCQTKEDQQKWVCLITERINNIGAKASPLPFHKPRTTLDNVHTDAVWSVTHLRPSPPARSCTNKSGKAPKNVEKNFEDDAQILRVIEGYCGSLNSRYTVASDTVDEILETTKVKLEEIATTNSDDNLHIMKTVYGLKEVVSDLQQKVDSLTQNMDDERSARELLENRFHSYITTIGANDLISSE